MIDIIFAILVVVHSSAIALGVGASSVAIAGFLTAIADGTFDPSERRIMGVVYLSLRIAMGMILVTSAAILWLDPSFFGSFTAPLWFLMFILFLNALLMTKHWIPYTLGPAIQAGTWYTLGFLITIYIFDFATLNIAVISGFYLADLLLAFVIVNACMAYLKKRRRRKQ